MKPDILIPDTVFEEAELVARQLGLSRNELYTKALKAFLQKYHYQDILNQLNQVYSTESSEPDPILTKMQLMSLSEEKW